MTFDELDQKMRVFETAADYCVLPGVYMVARLDGRSFTRLTKEVCQFEAPFDEYSWTATTTKPRPMEDLVEFRVEIAWGSGSFTLSERRYDPNGLAAR